MEILARTSGQRILIFSVLTVFLLLPRAHAEERPLQLYEQKIKAGLIYNFIKYTEWPPRSMPGASSPITVCILGRDPFDGYLQPMEARTVKKRRIVIRKADAIADTASCHLLFLGAEKKDLWPQLRKFLMDKSILTIGDFAGFSDMGGMIEFGKKNNHIYMELNMEAITTAHLRVYDNLVKISKTMRPAPNGGQ